MRMWMVDPGLMCDKHLRGEHLECHMLAGCLVRGKSIGGYLARRIIQPLSLYERHDALAQEMVDRGFNHIKPIPYYLVPSRMDITVDKEESLRELAARCEDCSSKMMEDEG